MVNQLILLALTESCACPKDHFKLSALFTTKGCICVALFNYFNMNIHVLN